MFFEFLQHFADLSKSEQKIYLYCLQKKAFFRHGSEDLNILAFKLHLSYKTVWRAVKNLAENPITSSVVKYIHSDILPKDQRKTCLNVIAEVPFNYGEVEKRLEPEHKRHVRIIPRKMQHSRISPPVTYIVVDNQGVMLEKFTFSPWKGAFFELKGSPLLPQGGGDPGGGLRNDILPHSPKI